MTPGSPPSTASRRESSVRALCRIGSCSLPELHLHLSRSDRELVEQLGPGVNLSALFRRALHERVGLCSGCGRPLDSDVTEERAELQMVT